MQALRQWYLKFHYVISSFGFEMFHKDHYIYVFKFKNKFAILTLYIDDIIVVSNEMGLLKDIKNWLSSTFDMKDMGETAYIPSVEIHRD